MNNSTIYLSDSEENILQKLKKTRNYKTTEVPNFLSLNHSENSRYGGTCL